MMNLIYEPDTLLKKILCILLFITFFLLLRHCMYPAALRDQIDSILKNDPQIQAEYGKVKHYKFFGKSIFYFGDVNEPASYIYQIKVEGEKKQGEIELKIYKFPERAPKPYLIELKDE